MSREPGRALIAALSVVAGMVDVTSWLTLGGLFTAHITGNIVVIAADFVSGRHIQAAQALAVPLFMIVAATIATWARLAKPSERTVVQALIFTQAILLLMAAVAAVLLMPAGRPHGVAAGTVAMLAVASMAAQNALLHLTARPSPTTSVMTGNVIVASMSLAAAVASGWKDEAAQARWSATWPILGGFLTGCVVGAAMVSLSADLAWGACAVAAVLCSATATRSPASARDLA